MKPIRIIIAGGREFNKYRLLRSKCDYFIKNLDINDIEVVSGKARGADKLGERWADERNIPIEPFPADWDKYGKKAAGPIRNRQMAEYATHLIAFWDGKSRGTENMIEEATLRGLNIRVIMY